MLRSKLEPYITKHKYIYVYTIYSNLVINDKHDNFDSIRPYITLDSMTTPT